MKRKKHKSKFVSRKLKKALKNYPCKKTRLGRYVIEVLDSYYDDDYEHPLGNYFHYLVNDENPIWSWDDEVGIMIDEKYNSNNIEFNEDKHFDYDKQDITN